MTKRIVFRDVWIGRFKALLIIAVVFVTSEAYAGYEKLTKAHYEESKDKKAVILYGVNWGRKWGCAGFDNAQLHNLTFSRIDSVSSNLSREDIVLNNPAKLLARNVSESYAIIVEPGEYALIGFDIKVAKSQSDVSHIKIKNKDLFENGRPVGGTFKVSAGEIVYIGDFGLDCVGNEPIPWRYYIQSEDFESYVAGFKKKYKFAGDKPITYRLFRTDKFGQEK